MKRKLLLIQDKYQEDSDDEDVDISQNDTSFGYLQTTFSEIVSKLCKQISQLLISSKNRKLNEIAQEFHSDLYLN